MEITLGMKFDKKALDAAREQICARRAEIEMLRKVVQHYQSLCPHLRGGGYTDRSGTSCFGCDDCGYDR
jgi:hypothetical protein